ncbi:hypothetical protein TorRG33x02_029780 [Trema orientale]|uniref:Uncharacterized protein n=1 Tax=Trema orientale TaxID=63057 RepID=A0A2P5FTV4_TREOI|nr:hypothetical protein TorRG33x02_029780 [Trema orientale]
MIISCETSFENYTTNTITVVSWVAMHNQCANWRGWLQGGTVVGTRERSSSSMH